MNKIKKIVINGVPYDVDGKSAYQIACEQGFVGTEEEWLASLKGEKGENGENGKDGKDGADIELAQDVEGESTDKAVSQKAVNVGLGGKVDVITDNSGMWLYTHESGKPNKRRLATNPSSYNVPLYNSNSNLTTNDPKEDKDAAHKKFVEDGFVKKTQTPLRLYGTKGVDSDGNTIHGEYELHYIAMKQGAVLQVTTPTNVSFDKTEPTQTAAVCDPQKPFQISNKRYVDRVAKRVEQGIYNALGTSYVLQEVTDFGLWVPVPSGAMNHAFIESIGVIYAYATDGAILGECNIRGIKIGDEYYGTTTPMYLNVEGVDMIQLEADVPEGTTFTKSEGGKIIFQVKVGG